jgi:hypothetical protein
MSPPREWVNHDFSASGCWHFGPDQSLLGSGESLLPSVRCEQIPGLCLLPLSTTIPPSQLRQPIISLDIAKCPWGMGKNHLLTPPTSIENHLYRKGLKTELCSITPVRKIGKQQRNPWSSSYWGETQTNRVMSQKLGEILQEREA